MEVNKKSVIQGAVCLIVGLVIGWLVLAKITEAPKSHVMPDGTIMDSNGATMSDMMHDMAAGLEGKKGDTFDQEFLREMIVHHEGAVLMAEAALKDAKHQEIRDMAKAIISAQTVEINQMKEWLRAWYGNQ